MSDEGNQTLLFTRHAQEHRCVHHTHQPAANLFSVLVNARHPQAGCWSLSSLPHSRVQETAGMRQTEEVDGSRMDGLKCLPCPMESGAPAEHKPLGVAPESGGQLQSVYYGPFGDDRCYHKIPQTSWDTGGAGCRVLPYPHLTKKLLSQSSPVPP